MSLDMTMITGMEIRLDGKVALVTGGSRGIGLAIASRLVEAGADVMITSRKADALSAAADRLAAASRRVEWMTAHAGDPHQASECVKETIRRLGSVDILVNNAATNPYFGHIMDIDEQMASKTVEVNQQGILMWSKCAWHEWMEENGGCILNMASVGGLEVEPAIGWYNVTKAAVLHLTRQMAYEMSPGVRVNALAPGLVKTDFARILWDGPHGNAIAGNLPLKRLGEPDDIARLALFVVSDAASWITGNVFIIDGGAMVMPSGGISR
jgi:NAD(P)-dependent dehydrogenase (short-subunit alcohol dehydrogenase family)